MTAPFHQWVTLYVSLKESWVAADATHADAALGLSLYQRVTLCVSLEDV